MPKEKTLIQFTRDVYGIFSIQIDEKMTELELNTFDKEMKRFNEQRELNKTINNIKAYLLEAKKDNKEMMIIQGFIYDNFDFTNKIIFHFKNDKTTDYSIKYDKLTSKGNGSTLTFRWKLKRSNRKRQAKNQNRF